MRKSLKIGLIALAAILIACLIGLIVTGYMIGWGPFGRLRFYNRDIYDIGVPQGTFTQSRKTIEGPNGTIVGYLFTPDDAGETEGPLLILSHGLATASWNNLNTATTMAAAGLRVFIFDYCGGSIHAESDGKTTDMSILTEKSDLNAVIDAVKTWEGIDPERIYLTGYSQGGLVAALTAAERDDIAKLCLIYPAFSMYYEIREDYKTAEEIPEKVKRNGMMTGKVYYADIISMEPEDIYAYAAQYTGPVMIQHGTADLLVPYECGVMADSAYPASCLVTLEGAGHGFTGGDDVYSVRKQYDFFTDRKDGTT